MLNNNPARISSQISLIAQAESGSGINSCLLISSAFKVLSPLVNTSAFEIDESLIHTKTLSNPNQDLPNLSKKKGLGDQQNCEEPKNDEPGMHKGPKDKNNTQNSFMLSSSITDKSNLANLSNSKNSS